MNSYFGTPTFAMETQTAKGIRGLANTITIGIVAAILAMIMAVAAIAIVGRVTGTYDTNLLASAIGVLALLCGLVALYLVMIILAIIGFWGVYKGRTEYGIAHERDVGRAMTFFIAAVVLFFASLGVSLASEAAALGDLSNPSDVTFTPSPVFSAVSAVIGTLFSVMVVLILYYLVKAFTPPEKQNLGIAAVGLYVLGTVLSGVLNLAFPISSNIADFNPWRLVPGIVSGLLGMISLVLFLVLYRDVYRRLKSHQIKPVWGTMAAQYPLQAQEYRWQPPPSY